MKPIAKSV